MKYLIFIIFNFALMQPSQDASDCEYSYASLDQALIELWDSSKNSDNLRATVALDRIDREWNLIVPDLYKFLNPVVNIQDFNKDMDYLIISMKISLYGRDFGELSQVAIKMLYQFKALREHQFNMKNANYPIDAVLDMVELYEEIDDTVHDQMFGLKYWFEFEDMVLGFNSEWDAYKKLSIENVTQCFPHIVKHEHDIKIEKVEECLSFFLASLESGYRTDFEIPCDQLGSALSDLLVLYSDFGEEDVTHKN